MIFWILACRPEEVETGSKLMEGGVVQCASPEKRSEAPFDQLTLPDLIDASEANQPIQYGGGSLAVADLTGDGLYDLLLPNVGIEQLYINKGISWQDERSARWVEQEDSSVGAVPVDYDGDADLDLFITNMRGPNRLMRNDGGVFTDVTAEAGVGGGDYDSIAASFADFDKDGDLDLFVANHRDEADLTDGMVAGEMMPGHPSELYRNNGDGTFSDISSLLPIELQDNDYPFVGGWIDIDLDGWLDLYVINDFGPMSDPNMYLHNEEGEGFTWVQGNGLDIEMYAMGLGIGDINQDGLEDLAVADWGRMVLLKNDGMGGFYDGAQASGLVPGREDRAQSWGIELADMDNDGDLDVPVAFGPLIMPPEYEELFEDEFALTNPQNQPDALFLQQEDGLLVDVADSWDLAQTGISRGFALADLNQDGFLDIVKRYLDAPATVHLSRCDMSAWLEVEFLQPGLNVFAIGAQAVVEAGGKSQLQTLRAGGTGFASGQPPVLHFGLGEADQAELTVIWPDGVRESLGSVTARQKVRVVRE